MIPRNRVDRIKGKGTNRLLLPALLAALVAATPAVAGNGFCPPGLAKKSPACMPPGQAKKFDRAWPRDDHHWPRIGDRIDRYDYHRIRYPDRYDLPPLRAGERYYVVDGRIFRVDQGTYEILDFVRAASALLD